MKPKIYYTIFNIFVSTNTMLQLIEFDWFISTWWMTSNLSKTKPAISSKDEKCEILAKISLVKIVADFFFWTEVIVKAKNVLLTLKFFKQQQRQKKDLQKNSRKIVQIYFKSRISSFYLPLSVHRSASLYSLTLYFFSVCVQCFFFVCSWVV